MSTTNKTRCSYIKADNTQCKRLCNDKYCWQHSDIVFKAQTDLIICKSDFEYNFNKIGSGSYGNVFKYSDLVYKESKLFSDLDTLEDTNLREICFYSQFSHGSIPTLQCVREINYKNLDAENKLQTYMKYTGNTLFTHFGFFYDKHLLYIIYQLLLLLDSLYQNGIIHGDIKPNNITVDSEFNAHLIDWGTFNLYSRYNRYSLGTRNYEAPESYYLDYKFIDGINDVYRLGMSILHLYDFRIQDWSESKFKTYYNDSKNVRLDTSEITDSTIRKLVDWMITIDHEKRPYASELLKDSAFDRFKTANLYNLKQIQRYKLKIKPFKYFSRDTSDLQIYRESTLGSEIASIKMRKILLDWIWEVCALFRIPHLFLHVCILIDNYLSFNIVNTKELQLVGMSAIFISSMFYSNTNIGSDLIYVCDKAYSIDALNSLVIKMLQFFDYKIYIQTPDLMYDYTAPYKTDTGYIKLRDLIVKQESFGIIHLFDRLDELLWDNKN